MSLSHKAIHTVTVRDLEQLQQDQVRENKVIEYKLKEPEKPKFLASICSFANCMGGDLLLGVKEEGGLPVEFSGVSITNVDAEISRLENLIRDGIEPRITSLAYQPVPMNDSKFVMILRIPRSWALPHRVKESRRFFSRHSTGKYELDIPEIRGAFGLSDTTMEKIRGFRAARLSQIVAGEMPVPMQAGPKLILHIVPLSAYDLTVRLDAAAFAKHSPQEIGWRPSHNFDGFLISEHADAIAMTYLQLFRNGAMELVDDQWFQQLAEPGKNVHRLINSRYETDLLERIPRYLNSLKALGVAPPFVLMLSLIGVTQFTMQIWGLHSWHHTRKQIEKDALLVPDILIENYDADLPVVLKPAFDSVWNAAGLPHSIHYDDEGNWNPQRTT
jgi:hypothetical protein